jgi:outer membrane protein OmpA-like peptidoglycan-associated protein
MPRAARLVVPVVVLAAVVAAGAYFLAHHPAPRTGDLPRPASAGAGATVYTTTSDILFDVDSVSLHPEAIPVLQRIAADIAEHPGRDVQVEGYTDDQGSDGYNLVLSRSRAETVKAWLVHAGIAEDRIGATGFGEAYPVAENDSDAHRQANRRVVIVLPPSPGAGAATASPTPSTVPPSGVHAGPRTRSASSAVTGGG